MQVKLTYNHIIESMPKSRLRDSQLQMVEAIDQCFKQSNPEVKDGRNLCLIEAPTGTGKSLAYLIAGVINGQKLGKKLLISTATKTLQSQLVDKDIPAFIKYSGIKFNYGLAKGRGNYLCPYQLNLTLQGLSNGDLFADSSKTQEQLNEIYQNFVSKIWDGDLDASPIHFENKLKPLITTDKDRCLGYTCPYNQKDECNCPFYINREKLKNCDVIVTNHSLLLADLTLGGGNVLPVKPNDYLLCLDEGHKFADSAVNSFTQMFELKHAIGNCQNLAKLIYNSQTQYVYTDTKLCDELFDKVTELVQILDEFLFLLSQNTHLFIENRIILNDYLNPSLSGAFRDSFVNFAYIAGEAYARLYSIIDKLKEQLKANPDYLIEANLNKLGFYATVVEGILVVSQYVINQDDSRYNANAKWIEFKSNRGNDDFAIYAGLTHVGSILFDKLWSKAYAAIITSATLAIGNDFSYYKHKLGLNLYPEVGSYKLTSNFVYQEQGQIVVPRFKYAPEYKTRDLFSAELSGYLAKILDYEDGYGTLVLFFNRNQLQEVYNALPKVVQKRILLQTEYTSNHKLINEHKKIIDSECPSIIFGLNSFAEGVDLPSVYCMHVIITKLPFDTHKDPQNMVQEYWVRFEKGSYFVEVALPEACIRLIQAAGRLIRDEDDYGQVSICDNRLITKDYGAILLDALPKFNRKYNSVFIESAFAKIAHKVI